MQPSGAGWRRIRRRRSILPHLILLILRLCLTRGLGIGRRRFRPGTRRAVGAVAGEHQERGDPVVERQYQPPPVDLGDLPAADVIAYADAHDLVRRTGADDGLRSVAIHHDAEERHVRRRRWRRRLRRDDDWWGRCRGAARRREQWTRARRGQAIERLRGQRTWESNLSRERRRVYRFPLPRLRGRGGRGARRRIGRRNRRWREHQQRRDGDWPKQGHAVPRRQLARSPSVTRNGGSSAARCEAVPASCTASCSTNA